jgi:hypothetical protein
MGSSSARIRTTANARRRDGVEAPVNRAKRIGTFLSIEGSFTVDIVWKTIDYDKYRTLFYLQG